MAKYHVYYEGGSLDTFEAGIDVFQKYQMWMKEPMQHTSWARFAEGPSKFDSIVNFTKVARMMVEESNVPEMKSGYEDLLPGGSPPGSF